MGVEKLAQVTQAKTWNAKLGHEGVLLYGRYTFGLAGEKFFREILENARLIGTRCEQCNLSYLPPRIYCERCFSELKEWVNVPTTGVVHSFTLAYVDSEGNRLSQPVPIALVKFEGYYGGLVHRFGEVEPEEVRIGMPVEISFKPRDQRVGSILDIQYFRPRRK